MGREKRRIQLEKETAEREIDAKRRELSRTQSEVERQVKDVQEQRDQLYRKLEVLQSKGIEVGPNMSILKRSELGSSPSDHNNSNNVSPTGTVNLSANSSTRKPSAVLQQAASMTSTASIASGGSLKKDSVANLNLLSTTNESKQGVEKPEIRQQIPMKLSTKLSVSSTSALAGLNKQDKDRSKKLSSVVGLKQVNTL